MILVCVDGSPASREAVALGVEWSSRMHLPLKVLYVQSHQEARLLAQEFGRMQQVRDVLDAQDAQIADFLDDLSKTYVKASVQYEVRQGPVIETILQAAEEADYLMMGIDGKGSALKRWVIGSVSEAVMKKAPCPVLLCRG